MLFYIMIESCESKKSFFQNFWVFAPHLGAALDTLYESLLELGIKNPIFCYADPVNKENLPEDVKVLKNKKIFYSENKYFYPNTIKDKIQLPYGIICSNTNEKFSLDDIKPGFKVYREENLNYLELNVSDNLFSTLYFEIISQFKTFQGFSYKIKDYKGKSDTEKIFINYELNSSCKIIAHLSNDLNNTIKNGFCFITSFLEEGETNINITDHKKIVIMTYSELIIKNVSNFLIKKGIKKRSKMVSIDSDFYHWHFRPADSLKYTDFIKKIKVLGFVKYN